MTEEQKKDYINLVNNSRYIAISSLKNLIKNLGFNEEAFEHIFNIQLKVGKTNNDALAEYDSEDFYIVISKSYLDEMIHEIKSKNDESHKKNVYLNVATTLVHEMIHANRTIMIENGLNATNLREKSDDEIIVYDQRNKEYDVESYDKLLNQVLEKSYSYFFEYYIPIKVRQNNDNTFTIIAFDKKSRNYVEFRNKSFNLKTSITDKDKFMEELGKELNSNAYSVDEVIYTKSNSPSKTVLSSDYYHEYDGKILKQDNVSTKEYASNLDKKVDHIVDRLENQVGFEEVITETIAIIATYSRNDNILDLNRLTTELESKEKLPDIKVGLRLINRMGIDMLKWFLTSSYDELYDDVMKKTFKDRYDDLLIDFNDLYESTIYEEEPNNFSINDALEIIEESTKSK